MGRPKKVEVSKKIETPKKTETTKKEEKPKKTETSKKKGKEEFSFKAINVKEERRAVIDELIGKPKQDFSKWEYTVDETDFTPKEWVVVLDRQGHIYQEPVPRYFDYKNFVYLLAGMPDKPIYNNKTISFEADYFQTVFEVKNVDCAIYTCSFNGYRAQNPFAECFDIKNGTVLIGGNIIFGGMEKGLNKKQAELVVKQIVKCIDSKVF